MRTWILKPGNCSEIAHCFVDNASTCACGKKTREAPKKETEVITEIDFDTKLSAVAVAFFNDNKGLPNYDLKTWQEQKEELKNNTPPSFIEGAFDTAPLYYLGLLKEVSQ